MLNDETRIRLRRLMADAVRPSIISRPRVATRRSIAMSYSEPSRVSSPIESESRPRGLEAGHEVVNAGGKHLLVRRDVETLWPEMRARIDQWNVALQHQPPSDALCDATSVYDVFRESFPRQAIFLDLETCGFAGAMIFLAGVIHVDATADSSRLVLSQLWARNYAEERAMLTTLRTLLQGQRVLVTFNGKSFDWPQVRDRCVLHERVLDGHLPELAHLDLLHVARRRWKDELPNCKLQTLERFICGRMRSGDIPGREIPDVYHQYVRTGDDLQVGSILYHNALDLVTLLQLAIYPNACT